MCILLFKHTLEYKLMLFPFLFLMLFQRCFSAATDYSHWRCLNQFFMLVLALRTHYLFTVVNSFCTETSILWCRIYIFVHSGQRTKTLERRVRRICLTFCSILYCCKAKWRDKTKRDGKGKWIAWSLLAWDHFAVVFLSEKTFISIH